ncbi:surface protease GP63 [Trypanosoma cruzi]|nr:surface protease GP63 [Trypanosoma cruzi]
MRPLIHVTLRLAALLLLLLMICAMCFASGRLAFILNYPYSVTMWCAPTARSILVEVGRMHLRAQDALHLCSGVWKDPWVPVRIKTSTTDPCDSRRHCGFSWSHAMNSLNDNRHCEDVFLSSAHGNILAEETVPAAVKLHADHLLVRPLEGPLVVPPLATSGVCSWFTVRDEHRSTGVANSDLVLCVAAVPGGV